MEDYLATVNLVSFPRSISLFQVVLGAWLVKFSFPDREKRWFPISQEMETIFADLQAIKQRFAHPISLWEHSAAGSCAIVPNSGTILTSLITRAEPGLVQEPWNPVQCAKIDRIVASIPAPRTGAEAEHGFLARPGRSLKRYNFRADGG